MSTYIKFSDSSNPIPYEIEIIDPKLVPKDPISINSYMYSVRSKSWFTGRQSQVRNGIYWSIVTDDNAPQILKAAMLLLKGIECLPDISSVKQEK